MPETPESAPAVESPTSATPAPEATTAPAAAARAAGSAFVEALAPAAGGATGRYRIRAIRAGESANRNYYPDAVLREAVPQFEGLRVFVKGDAEHLAGQGKDFRNLIGGLGDPKFVEGVGADRGEIQATLTLLEPDGPIGTKLREAWQRGLTHLFGFSIDASGSGRRIAGRDLREATSIRKVNSVDLIVEPGAGGRLIHLLEAKGEDIMDREQIIQLLEATRPESLRGKDTAKLELAELEALLREALAVKPAAIPAGVVTTAELQEQLRMVEAKAAMRASIAASALPARAKAKLTAQFEGLASFAEADVAKAIKDEGDYLAAFTESGTVRGLGGFSRIEAGETRGEKTVQMLDAFFDPAHKDHRHARSFREAYVAVTGDRAVTGNLADCDGALMREALNSASFPNVLGDSITRRMVAEYQRQPNPYGNWRLLTGEPVPLNDFRVNKRTRFGAYGDLPIVAEGAPYIPMSSPSDEQATYAPAKRGGTEQVTREMILNDDVGVIRRIPMRIADTAQRTLAKFVWDFVRTNPTIYDAIALFHASHGNLGAAALDAVSLAAARLAMLKQTELGSADRLNIPPATLLVPIDLEQGAHDLFQRGTNNDPTFIQRMQLTIQAVWYWTDSNDWALAADPARVPMIELGFVGGQEEPALFVQDVPTVGSMFSNDAMTWKIRHEYGGNVLDYRGLYKAVV
jgi:hypothetical protein